MDTKIIITASENYTLNRIHKIIKNLNLDEEMSIKILESNLLLSGGILTKNNKLVLKNNKDKNTEKKKPLTGYLIFCKEQRPILKEENPDLKPREIVTMLGNLWKKKDQNFKDSYNVRSTYKLKNTKIPKITNSNTVLKINNTNSKKLKSLKVSEDNKIKPLSITGKNKLLISNSSNKNIDDKHKDDEVIDLDVETKSNVSEKSNISTKSSTSQKNIKDLLRKLKEQGKNN